jgi:hypothetical protein
MSQPQQQNELWEPEAQETTAVRKAGDVVREVYHDIRFKTVLCQRLADEEAKRDLVLRKDGLKLNYHRRSNVEAILGQVVGDEPPQPCKCCRKGYGPWETCVVLEGHLCGSCTNCWYNASGSRCTFHGKFWDTPNTRP